MIREGESAISRDVRARQEQVFRTMTAEQKLAVARALYETAWELKAAGVRMMEPGWSEAEVQRRVRSIFRDAGA